SVPVLAIYDTFMIEIGSLGSEGQIADEPRLRAAVRYSCQIKAITTMSKTVRTIGPTLLSHQEQPTRAATLLLAHGRVTARRRPAADRRRHTRTGASPTCRTPWTSWLRDRTPCRRLRLS